MQPKQYTLSKEFKTEKEFGGALLNRSHAKKPRPVSTKNAMHVTLRSSKAKGPRSFLATRQRRLLIEKKIRTVGVSFGVSIYKLAIVGNHIHILLRATNRRGFLSFLRSITGIIARIVLGAERGPARSKENQVVSATGDQVSESKGARFWDQRPWTRVVAWMRDFASVKKYVQQNFDEAMGFVKYSPRKPAWHGRKCTSTA